MYLFQEVVVQRKESHLVVPLLMWPWSWPWRFCEGSWKVTWARLRPTWPDRWP
jgi:hypothetical protein